MPNGPQTSRGLVTAELTMSLDGFIAGPNDGADKPLGEGGERLHRWQYETAAWREPQGRRGGKDNENSKVIEEASSRVGAFVMGRRMFDAGEGPWGDTPPFRLPVFVVTHRPRDPVVKGGGTSFTFVTDGIEAALEQARAAAGDRAVTVSGGADIVRQFIRAGLLDELQIHVAPMLLGGGVSLFEGLAPPPLDIEMTRVISSPLAVHMRLRLRGAS